MNNLEKFVVLLETMDFDIQRFKYTKYKKYKKNPVLYNSFNDSYKSMLDVNEDVEIDDDDYFTINPLFYHKSWASHITYIEQIKVTHNEYEKGKVEFTFDDLYKNNSISESIKEEIMFDLTDEWLAEYRSSVEMRINIYDSVIENIQHHKIKNRVLRLGDLFFIIFSFIFAKIIIAPKTIPRIWDLRLRAISINEQMYDDKYFFYLMLFVAYGMGIFFIVKLFYRLCVRDAVQTFKEKDEAKERLKEKIEDAFLTQTATIEKYIHSFNDSSSAPRTKFAQFTELQNTVDSYEYFYDLIQKKFDWAINNKNLFENIFKWTYRLLVGSAVYIILQANLEGVI